MTISLYHAVVPQYLQLLPGVIANLDKAEAWAKDQGLSEAEMLAHKLAPDMLPLAAQFRMVAGHSGGALQAVSEGVFRVNTTPAPQDYASVRADLTTALAAVQAIDAAVLDARQNDNVDFEYGGTVIMSFTAQDYLLSFAQPNFYFHAVTAYAILRNLGLEVGKRDYLGAPRVKHPA
ncbi:MAG TPA: DUF1993 domain-containing protein [Sphingobium sp.]|uniref:DUF1993 domain-containing protein n=1 Tax=Sphingobium sp. TaxID=1912891 RepID=UPI002ED6511F